MGAVFASFLGCFTAWSSPLTDLVSVTSSCTHPLLLFSLHTHAPLPPPHNFSNTILHHSPHRSGNLPAASKSTDSGPSARTIAARSSSTSHSLANSLVPLSWTVGDRRWDDRALIVAGMHPDEAAAMTLSSEVRVRSHSAPNANSTMFLSCGCDHIASVTDSMHPAARASSRTQGWPPPAPATSGEEWAVPPTPIGLKPNPEPERD
mmetsp:Transcript_38117/g.77776  ORF Transcript_38117/g.77776 Transcript_38117/m.77776 type:complete len:206 (-) Transcript_38117:585-1202(-)